MDLPLPCNNFNVKAAQLTADWPIHNENHK